MDYGITFSTDYSEAKIYHANCTVKLRVRKANFEVNGKYQLNHYVELSGGDDNWQTVFVLDNENDAYQLLERFAKNLYNEATEIAFGKEYRGALGYLFSASDQAQKSVLSTQNKPWNLYDAQQLYKAAKRFCDINETMKKPG